MGMFSNLFPSGKGGDELAAVFHVGSSSVCGALFWMRKTGVPKIIFSVQEPITPEAQIDPENFLALTIKALDSAASQIAKSGKGAPRRLFCVLSSPWYVSQNRVIRLEKNAPFVFTAKLADSLIEKEIKLFEEEHLKKYVESGNKVRPIELKNLRTTLNDYEVVDPRDQKAKQLEMTMYISMSGEEALTAIEQALSRHFHRDYVKFSSFLMASYTVVRDMYVHQDNFLLVDIGGEVTDISMVKKNILKESVSYPVGRNFLIRGLSEKLGVGMEEAKSLFSLYKDGHAEDKVRLRVEPVINELKVEWLKKFQSSLANLSTDISVPATIFITIDREYADFFADVIKTEQFNQYTLTESKFQIIFLNTERLHGAAQFEDDVVRDTFVIADTIYINRFLFHR